jgi:hypothetical protein
MVAELNAIPCDTALIRDTELNNLMYLNCIERGPAPGLESLYVSKLRQLDN